MQCVRQRAGNARLDAFQDFCATSASTGGTHGCFESLPAGVELPLEVHFSTKTAHDDDAMVTVNSPLHVLAVRGRFAGRPVLYVAPE